MEASGIIGKTIVFDDAYTGVETYGHVDHEDVVHIVSKEEAGPNPIRVKVKPDPRIDKITGGTGVIE